ncbi:hypothetical protein PS922_02213 [Pseudomonas fluorescens]|uniref:Uncharacterized protein n=1 Tax=Pseudomonas fluorescens TaxID=294 RepID=A0A5E7SEZ7_PSEFL|nr:hypothetical protein PS922_02213 [Pseudomonas fluorescens]
MGRFRLLQNINDGTTPLDRNEMKEMLLHSIKSDEATCALSVSSKYNADRGLPLQTARLRTTRSREVAYGELPEYWRMVEYRHPKGVSLNATMIGEKAAGDLDCRIVLATLAG